MKSPWASPSRESEYLAYLQHERHMYAWCMQKHGRRDQEAALAAAHSFYQYEPPSPLRGLVFHDEAWHWAMLELHGDTYWKLDPSLETPGAEYRKESASWDARTSTEK